MRTLVCLLTHQRRSGAGQRNDARLDTITYFCTIIGASRAGVCVFLISTRNAAVAVADMAKRTGLAHLIVSSDAVMNEVADDAIKLLAFDGLELKKHRMPVFEDLFPEVPDMDSLFENKAGLSRNHESEAYSAIVHSSGAVHGLCCP